MSKALVIVGAIALMLQNTIISAAAVAACQYMDFYNQEMSFDSVRSHQITQLATTLGPVSVSAPQSGDGTFTFTFPRPTTIGQIGLFDTLAAKITTYTSRNCDAISREIDLPDGTGTTGYLLVDVEDNYVCKLDVEIHGSSGAIDTISYQCPKCKRPSMSAIETTAQQNLRPRDDHDELEQPIRRRGLMSMKKKKKKSKKKHSKSKSSSSMKKKSSKKKSSSYTRKSSYRKKRISHESISHDYSAKDIFKVNDKKDKKAKKIKKVKKQKKTKPIKTASPTSQPVARTTTRPRRTISPSLTPTLRPTKIPTASPTVVPTIRPTVSPTGFPSASPITSTPTSIPTLSPVANVTTRLTLAPTDERKRITAFPTRPPRSPLPTASPSVSVSQYPSVLPSEFPSDMPSEAEE